MFGEQQVESVARNENIKIPQPLQVEKFSTIPELISLASTKIQMYDQFVLVNRRGVTLQSKLATGITSRRKGHLK